jgi:hypothetical protein
VTFYAIDRIEGKIAVVIGDDGRSFDVPTRQLPPGCREGTVLRVDAGGGAINWSEAVIDEAERRKRLDRARETLRRLGEGDSGGDVEL